MINLSNAIEKLPDGVRFWDRHFFQKRLAQNLTSRLGKPVTQKLAWVIYKVVLQTLLECSVHKTLYLYGYLSVIATPYNFIYRKYKEKYPYNFKISLANRLKKDVVYKYIQLDSENNLVRSDVCPNLSRYFFTDSRTEDPNNKSLT